MSLNKHLKRFLKSCNKRLGKPSYQFIKPAIRWVKNDPYEIDLTTQKSFCTSDFAVVNNVLEYAHIDFNYWQIKALSSGYQIGLDKLSPNDNRIYVILETKFHEAFGHWFFESAIWIPQVKKILDAYPNSRIHLKETKGFKLQILQFFGVSEDRVSTQLPEHNTCIFVNPCTALNDAGDPGKFKEMLVDFSSQFFKNPITKTIDYLLMPRQKKENFVYNDRQIGTDDLEDYLKSVPSSAIYNTDNSPTFADQVKTLQNSRHILLTDGSPFMVNAFLAKHSVITVLGDTLVPIQRKTDRKLQVICEQIEHNNAIRYVHSSDNVFSRECLQEWRAQLENLA